MSVQRSDARSPPGRAGRDPTIRAMTGETDEQLDQVSRDLLRSLGELKDLENEKRQTGRSTEQFHELGERVLEKGEEVLGLARHAEAGSADDSPLPDEREDDRPGDWTDARS